MTDKKCVQEMCVYTNEYSSQTAALGYINQNAAACMQS